MCVCILSIATEIQSPVYNRHCQLGFNYRMSELQAAVALAQFEQLDSNSLCHNSTPNVETSMMYSHTHVSHRFG